MSNENFYKQSLQTEINRRYCQSCGMPLDIENKELLGTEWNGNKTGEYCCYCYKNGEYTATLSMDEAIKVWGNTCNLFNENQHTHYTPDEFKRMFKLRLPSLKRWQQKNTTRKIHFEIVNKLLTYINSHLFDDIDCDKLSQVANLSKYHLLRIFKEITGESAGNYILRIRLEHIAHLIVTTNMSLNEIVKNVNYYSKHSLSKAFKKYFGLSPIEYRKTYRNNHNLYLDTNNLFALEMRYIESFNVLYRAIDLKQKKENSLVNLWREIIDYKEKNGLGIFPGCLYVSISLDDPSIIEYNDCRFHLGIIVPEGFKADGKYGLMSIPEGQYAVFRHKGDYSSLYKLYREIYLMWLPQNGNRQSHTLNFEKYLNTPLDTDPGELETEIYIPIDKISSNLMTI